MGLRVRYVAINALAMIGAAMRSEASARGLGGYGGTMSAPGAGPMLIPYGGLFEGFLPGRLGMGAPLEFQSRPSPVISAGRKDFRLSSMPGLSLGRSRPMAGSDGGLDLLGGRRRPRSRAATGMMAPRIGYPFREPSGFAGPPIGGMGPSM